MDEFERLLDFFGHGGMREYVSAILDVHALSLSVLPSIGYFPERAYFRGSVSNHPIEFPTWEVLKFHQLRAQGVDLAPVIVWSHPDRVADREFSTENKLWIEYRTHPVNE